MSDPTTRTLPGPSPFGHGVASGDPTPDGVLLWTTVAAGAGAVRWEISIDERFDDVVASGSLDGDADGSVPDGAALPRQVRVGGLEPATEYHYRFVSEAGVIASEVGLTRTLPNDDAPVDRYRIGLACCSRLPTATFAPYAELARQRPELVVHLGDYIYEDGDEPHDPPHTCVSADDYRRRYAQYRNDPALRRLHSTAPWISVWDDHEVADDAWEAGSPGDVTSDHSAEWKRRQRDAADAYLDWLPQEASVTGPTLMDRRVRIGTLADIVVLDARQAGRERPVGESGPALVDPADDRSILSEEQWDWLATCVEECPGWLILCTQTQVSPLRLARLPNRRRRLRLHPLVNPAQWDGYPVERERLGRLLDTVAGRVLICSGDLHGRFHTALRTPSGRMVPEITTPSIASKPFAETIRTKVPIPTPVLSRWLAWLNPHVDHMDLESRGSTVLDISVDAIEVTGLVAGSSEPLRWRLERDSDSIV